MTSRSIPAFAAPTPNCIVHEPMEAQYVRNKFYIVSTAAQDRAMLRCMYCETDIDDFVVADVKKGHYTRGHDATSESRERLKDVVVYKDEAKAIEEGLRLKEPSPPPRRHAG